MEGTSVKDPATIQAATELTGALSRIASLELSISLLVSTACCFLCEVGIDTAPAHRLV